ncbi:MAG: phosphate ABC transporter permease subunit PstC [Anaerolineae bacterium]|nr:phosphate ABC transporter permease subunit PstC [Anaerolineae bacterium]
MRLADITDQAVRYALLVAAFLSVIILVLIAIFTLIESWDAFTRIGVIDLVFGTTWHPIPDDFEASDFGILGMIVASIIVTAGSLILGVPLGLGCAIFLAEIAPEGVRKLVRPAVELLAGIPSVIYGLIGMVWLVPIIRELIPIVGNQGFGFLAASIVLAVMILPTVINIAEDAIRAVPQEYREGSLALGSTRWQTITRVIVPAARSGIVAAIILGVGRALGETMAMVMVIGNSTEFPAALTANPLTIFLSRGRTLTGNVVMGLNYAAGTHRSALFATGIVLFVMIMIVNSMARVVISRWSPKS